MKGLMLEAFFPSFRVFDFAGIKLHHVMHFKSFLGAHMREVSFLEAECRPRIEGPRCTARVIRRWEISGVCLIWLILGIRFVIKADFSF